MRHNEILGQKMTKDSFNILVLVLVAIHILDIHHRIKHMEGQLQTVAKYSVVDHAAEK